MAVLVQHCALVKENIPVAGVDLGETIPDRNTIGNNVRELVMGEKDVLHARQR